MQKQFWRKQKEEEMPESNRKKGEKKQKLLEKKETLEVKRKLEEKLAMLRWQAKYIDDNQKWKKVQVQVNLDIYKKN